MAHAIVQTIFSPAVLGIVRTVLVAACPDQYDWIPGTVLAVVGAVDDVDRIDATGPAKFDAVVSAVRETLDSADDIPGWSSLNEDARDRLIGGLVNVVVFAIRAAESKGLPEQSARVAFADALRDLTLAAFDLADAFEHKTTAPKGLGSVAAVAAAKLG